MILGAHGGNVPVVLLKKCDLGHMAEMVYILVSKVTVYVLHRPDTLKTCRCKLQLFPSQFRSVKNQCYLCHISATVTQQIMLPGKDGIRIDSRYRYAGTRLCFAERVDARVAKLPCSLVKINRIVNSTNELIASFFFVIRTIGFIGF